MNNLTINSYNNYNNPHFGKKLIGNINLRQITKDETYKLVKGTFSELEPRNTADIAQLEGIRANWKSGSVFSGAIINDFEKAKKSSKVFITELKHNCADIKDKICCLMETTNPEKNPEKRNNFVIKYLQSAPAIADKTILPTPILGAGELSLYEAVKIAKQEGYKRVKLFSVNNSFYEHVGFIKSRRSNERNGTFFLPDNLYNDFLKKVETKYNLKDTIKK